VPAIARVQSPQLMAEALDRFREYLATQGLRLTRQRETVARALMDASDHLSADELAERLRGEGVSKSTVYRTLQLLVEAGLADGQDYGDGRLYYELMVGRHHHDHLVCLSCGQLIEFQSPEIERLQDRVAESHDFDVVSHTHKLFGYCSRCRARPGKRPRPSEASGRRGRMGFFKGDGQK
jgi:Fur family transcriptional regulator, ferric uptake regulator